MDGRNIIQQTSKRGGSAACTWIICGNDICKADFKKSSNRSSAGRAEKKSNIIFVSLVYHFCISMNRPSVNLNQAVRIIIQSIRLNPSVFYKPSLRFQKYGRTFHSASSSTTYFGERDGEFTCHLFPCTPSRTSFVFCLLLKIVERIPCCPVFTQIHLIPSTLSERE